MKNSKLWIKKDAAIRAVNDEPELPGEMPDEMWNAIRNDRDAVAEALRIAVRQTKSGIIKRMAAMPNDQKLSHAASDIRQPKTRSEN